VASSLGIEGKAKGSIGVWLILSEWAQDKNNNWYRKDVKTVEIDGKDIKADTWYQLKKGEFVAV
jgi:hypothetical protein